VSALDVQIVQAWEACEAGSRELAALREEARGACCPWCVLGERWTGPYRAQWVRVVELVRLLHERRGPEDVEQARKVYREFWP
jgi:hypothetical protein